MNLARRAAASVLKKTQGLQPNAPLASTKAVNGNGGGTTASAPTLTAALTAHAVLDALEPGRLDQQRQAVFAELPANPERSGAADQGAHRGEERVEPEQLGPPRRENHHREVDPERQEEQERGVERPHQDEPARRQEVSEERVEQ